MTNNNESARAALQAAQRQQERGKVQQIQLSTGYEVIVHPVSQVTIQDAQSLIKDPPVPRILDDGRAIFDDKDPEYLNGIENPDHPHYTISLRQANDKRGMAVVDIILIKGVEIVGGVPEDDDWLDELQFMAKRGLISLDGFDLTNKFDRAFLYKRHIVVGTEADWQIVMAAAMGVKEEDIERAMASFRGQTARDTDNPSTAKEPQALPEDGDNV